MLSKTASEDLEKRCNLEARNFSRFGKKKLVKPYRKKRNIEQIFIRKSGETMEF